MRIEAFVDSVKSDEFDNIRNKTLNELVNYIMNNHLERYYITLESSPIYIFNHEEIINIFFKNILEWTFEEFYNKEIKNKYNDLYKIEANRHIIDVYNQMRKAKLHFAPVIKNEKLIGEIAFSTLSLKISFIAIKDVLTNTYNQKYFNVLIDEYNEISQDLGIIMIKIYNLAIFESLYGYDFKNKILKLFGEVIKNSVRDVDFVFRNDDIFKILTFNDSEVTLKIKHRIEDKLKDLEVDKIAIPYKVVATHVPELEPNVFLAIENLEEKLIKRD
jgi:diguanylate cyclase (GGDEF)-like protein